MKKILIIYLCLFTQVSCEIEDLNKKEKVNTNKIINLLINEIIDKQLVYFAFPAPPPNLELSLDSLYKEIEKDRAIPKDTVQIINKMIIEQGKLLIAVDSSFFTLNEKHLKQSECNKKDDFNNTFKIKNIKKIDFNKIQKSNFYKIIPSTTGKILSNKNQRLNYHMHLGFSEIAYNKENSKAIIIVGVALTKLNGFTSIYYLEKKNGLWKIECKKELNIS